MRLRSFLSFIAEKENPRPLYVCRPVTNTDDILDWARSQGFKKMLDPEQLHVTVAYSKTPVHWGDLGDHFDALQASPGIRSVEPLGGKGAVVLKFEQPDLQRRWQQFCDRGCSWDYPSYKPHMTITYQGADIDLNQVEPFQGVIKLGAEAFETIADDFKGEVKHIDLD